MDTALGRGGHGRVTLHGDYVEKYAEAWEPTYMRAHASVFVPVTSISEPTGLLVRYAMPQYRQAGIEHLFEGAYLLKRNLWTCAGYAQRAVADPIGALRDHLNRQIVHFELSVNPRFVKTVLHRIAEWRTTCAIHGDPTVANLVVSPAHAVWWIDPLDRPYIPGDPHVDLGKMYQSCFGYEDVLLGRVPRVRYDLMWQLACETGLDYYQGLLWCYVHIVRLLPYVEPRVRQHFERVLRYWSIQ